MAWTLFGTALFQGCSYSCFSYIFNALYKRYCGEKLWALPVPKAEEIMACVDAGLKESGLWGKQKWTLYENVPGIFWSVGLFVRRHLPLEGWLASRTMQGLWRDLSEIYYMGKNYPRPKVCIAVYRLTAPQPLGLGLDYDTTDGVESSLPFPLTLGCRRYLSFLGPASGEAFSAMKSDEKVKLASDLYYSIAETFPKNSPLNHPFAAVHALQFFLESGKDGFICRVATKDCTLCPLRNDCQYASPAIKRGPNKF